MKAIEIGVKLTAIYKNIQDIENPLENKFGPMIVHDEHRI